MTTPEALRGPRGGKVGGCQDVGAGEENRTLQEPVRDPARFPWHEVSKIQHYWLNVSDLGGAK